MSPKERQAKMQEEREEQIKAAKKRTEAAQARYNAAKVNK